MIRDVTLPELVERAAERWPEGLALTHGERSWTFAQVAEEARAAADRLAGLGVRPGERVGVWAANLPEWVFLEFGIARLGAVLVTVNTALGRDDLGYLLADSGLSVLVAGREARGHDFTAVLRGLDRERLPGLRHVVLLEGGDVPGARAWAELELPAAHVPAAPLGLDDLVNMQYTSGTTGFPKGVMLSSRNVVGNGWRTGRHLGLSPDDRVLCQVPLFHCFGCVATVLASYTHGASVHLVRTFDPALSLEAIERWGVTCVHGVPAMFQAMLDHPDAERRDLSRLRTGIMAGAVCPPSLMARLISRWNVREMTVGYGLTESSPALTYTPRDDPPQARCGTVGRPLPDTELRLVDPATGRDAERGELWARGEQVMLGYWGRPEATADAVVEGGWLRTGDLAERDREGRYRIVGRIKEMICRGGENVYPAEVEEAIRSHPAVADVAVFGVPDERLGETVGCCVVARAGARLDEKGVLWNLEGRIARSKIPKFVRVVDALPMTASGKVQRFVLSERYADEPAFEA